MVRTGNGFDELGFSRLFLGIAIGVASFTVPLYIAEIAQLNPGDVWFQCFS